jgi:hypothetical protein
LTGQGDSGPSVFAEFHRSRCCLRSYCREIITTGVCTPPTDAGRETSPDPKPDGIGRSEPDAEKFHCVARFGDDRRVAERRSGRADNIVSSAAIRAGTIGSDNDAGGMFGIEEVEGRSEAREDYGGRRHATRRSYDYRHASGGRVIRDLQIDLRGADVPEIG